VSYAPASSKLANLPDYAKATMQVAGSVLAKLSSESKAQSEIGLSSTICRIAGSGWSARPHAFIEAVEVNCLHALSEDCVATAGPPAGRGQVSQRLKALFHASVCPPFDQMLSDEYRNLVEYYFQENWVALN
jgi:hypothetical protein